MTAGFDDWVDEFEWAPDSRSIAFVSHVAARGNIYRVAVEGGSGRDRLEGRSATHLDFAPDGRRLYFSSSSIEQPADLRSIGADGKGARAETNLNAALLSEASRGKVQERWVTSADGRKLQGWLALAARLRRVEDLSGDLLRARRAAGAPGGRLVLSLEPRRSSRATATSCTRPTRAARPGFGQKFVDEISRRLGRQGLRRPDARRPTTSSRCRTSTRSGSVRRERRTAAT